MVKLLISKPPHSCLVNILLPDRNLRTPGGLRISAESKQLKGHPGTHTVCAQGVLRWCCVYHNLRTTDLGQPPTIWLFKVKGGGKLFKTTTCLYTSDELIWGQEWLLAEGGHLTEVTLPACVRQAEQAGVDPESEFNLFSLDATFQWNCLKYNHFTPFNSLVSSHWHTQTVIVVIEMSEQLLIQMPVFQIFLPCFIHKTTWARLCFMLSYSTFWEVTMIKCPKFIQRPWLALGPYTV